MNLYRVAWGYYPPDPRKAQEHLVLAQSKGQCKRWAVQKYDTLPDVISKYTNEEAGIPLEVRSVG